MASISIAILAILVLLIALILINYKAFVEILYYTYFRIYKFYSRWGEDTPQAFAIAIMVLLESCNIMFFVYVFSYYENFEFKISYWVVAPYFAIFYFINYKIFINCNLKSAKKWDNEKQSVRDLKGFLIILFIIFSIVLMFGWVTYMHNQKVII